MTAFLDIMSLLSGKAFYSKFMQYHSQRELLTLVKPHLA